MSQMTPLKTIRTTLFQLFSDNVAGILLENIKLFARALETGRQANI
jgi:hypothetical protein